MKCFMLQKCLASLQDDNADDINVQVSCACCGSIVKESNIEHNDDCAKENCGGKDERDLLQSRPPRVARFGCCFSLRRKSVTEKDKRLAEKAIDLHSPLTSAKDLSQS